MEQETEQLGHILNCKIESTVPPMNCDMSLSSIMILVGKNGTGKTFVLVLQYICATYLIAHFSGVLMTEELQKQLLQKIVSGSLDTKELTGEFTFTYKSVILSFKADKGEITWVSVTMTSTKKIIPTPVIYMSSAARLYAGIKTYMTMRKMFIDMGLSQEEYLEKLGEIYKMYDMTYYETVIGKLDKSYTLSEDLQKSLVEKYDFTDTIVSVRLEDTEILVTRESGKEHSVANMGSGEQALFTIFICGEIIRRTD